MTTIRRTLENEIAALRLAYWTADQNEQWELRDEAGERMNRLLDWFESRYGDTLNTGPYDV